MKKKLAVSAVSILLTLLFAEAALRILGIGAAGRGSSWFARGNHPRFLFQPDPESGYTLRPGFGGREIAPGPLRFARDGHWNAAGHEAMGRALAVRIPARASMPRRELPTSTSGTLPAKPR